VRSDPNIDRLGCLQGGSVDRSGGRRLAPTSRAKVTASEPVATDPSRSCPPARPVGAVHPTTQREAAITTTTQPAPARTTVGVGPHAEAHAAVANDGFGRRQDTTSVATTPAADAGLLGWARRLGQVEAWGIEGTGSLGAGLTRFRHAHGQVVVEVNRPDRAARRRRGTADPVDAGAAARAVQAREGAVPKAGDGQVAMVRPLRVARATATKARTRPSTPPKALVVAAPDGLRGQLGARSAVRLAQAAAGLAPGPVTTPAAAARLGLGTLARRYQVLLSAELAVLEAGRDRLTGAAAPKLVARLGSVGLGRGAAGRRRRPPTAAAPR